MNVIATRKRMVEYEKLIEVISQRLVTESLKSNNTWIKLQRKCVITGKLLKAGDSVSLIMYLEDNQQKSGGCLTSALQGGNQVSEQTTLTWHYLPELPPEPEDGLDASRYLVAINEPRRNGFLHAVTLGWYEGDGYWLSARDDKIHDLLYAWAKWPEAPPVQES